jgi:secretion/DNA translocation related TadE-like protein
VAGDGGSAVVWVVCLIALLAAATTVVVAYGTAVALRHRADAAADLAALAAAAETTVGPVAACRAAERTATVNGATLGRCRLEEGIVTVAVTARGRGPLGSALVATRWARAGPASTAPGAPGVAAAG